MSMIGHMNYDRNAGHHAEMNKGEFGAHVLESWPITYSDIVFACMMYFLIWKPVRRNK